MFGGDVAFFSRTVAIPLVRNGVDDKYVQGDHTMMMVYPEMYLQICVEYNSLPPEDSLTLSKIRFFYNGIRASLKKSSEKK